MSIKNIGLTLMGVAVAFTLLVAPASAQSIADLNAMIAQLTAQLGALGGASSGSMSYGGMSCPVPSLTIGSTGTGVTTLQTLLVNKGYLTMPAGVAMGYFGELTKSAVMKWQAAAGVSATGYYGPLSAAACNAMMGGGGVTPPPVGGTCPNGYLLSNNCMAAPSGTTCPNGNLLSNNCMPGSNTGTPTGPLTGGAGSIEDADFLSGIQNEKVGEDEEDVAVSTIQLDADEGSDIELTAIRLDFDASTGVGSSDFEDYASEVSIWLDGEELARVDADEFNDDNNYDRTISLDSGGMIQAGLENAELVVKVSGISNLDTGDAGDTWTLIVENVRFKDAQGASVTDSATGALGAETRTFTFETFATAVNAELKIRENNDDINDAHVIDVHASDDTNDIPVLSFTLEAEGDSDLTIERMSASTTVTTAANVDDVAKEFTLWLDGEEIASGECSSNFGGADADCAAVGTTESYLFNDLDYTIAAGDTVDGEIRISFHSVADALNEGDSISVAITESSTDHTVGWKVEDESGTTLLDADITGTVNSAVESHVVYDVGIQAKFVSASNNLADISDEQSGGFSGGDDTGTYKIVFDVTSFGADVFIDADLVATTTATTMVAGIVDADSGIFWATTTNSTASTTYATGNPSALLECAGTETNDVLTAGSLSFEINENTTRRCTLTVGIGPVTGDVQVGIRLRGISWDTESGDIHDTLYNFDMGDYKTSTVSLLNT